MSEKKTQISEEIRLIPWWAFGLAVVLFVGIQVALHMFGFRGEHNPPPFPLRVLFPVLAGTIVAFVVLGVGYVNRDAKHRNMNSALWTVLVIFIPNAIGFILYFLLRQPLLVPCPQCGTLANSSFNFCPKCKYNLRPTCPACSRAIQAGNTFCPYCAHELKGAAV